MSPLSGVTDQSVSTLERISRSVSTHTSRQTAAVASAPVRPGDQAEFSQQARQLSGELARESGLQRKDPAVREDLVRRIREQIDLGEYDSDDKLDTALDRMINSLDRNP